MEQLVEKIVSMLPHMGLVEVEMSARHVHLTARTAEILFGSSQALHPKRRLSQPGQFLAEERVNLYGPKGMMERVAVLGPLREYNQVELSKSDCVALGLKDIPVRESGDLEGSGSLLIEGSCGQLQIENSVIIAHRHIHAPIGLARELGLSDGQRVAVRMITRRPAVLEDVIVRISRDAGWRMHIDVDEANAVEAAGFTLGKIL